MLIDRRAFLGGATALVLAPGRFFESSVTAKVHEGVVAGVRLGGVNIFKGVPFAKPPVGALRFRAPQPPEPWIATRDATTNAPIALQASGGSEDCLYLNVFAPVGSGPFPVLVWIHGGANTGGSTLGHDGSNMARQGIVVVTLAYRLGALGFMELGSVLGNEYNDSGVNGILDLAQALRWLKENVSAFGGDPARITIAGQSAGAKNVAALMGLSSARGLFSRAIMESGGGQTVHTRKSAHRVATLMLNSLGLKKGEERQLLTLSGKALIAAQQLAESEFEQHFAFRPFVGGKAFPKRPVDLVNGTVPLLLGTNRDESIAFMSPNDASKAIRSNEIANAAFANIEIMEAKYKVAFSENSDLERRVRLLTAEEYWIPSVRFAEAHSGRGGHTQMYRFDHHPTSANDPHAGFSAHGAEVGLVWNHHAGWSLHEEWASFVKGDPLPEWPEYSTHSRQVLVIGQNGTQTVEADPRGDERKLWDHVL